MIKGEKNKRIGILHINSRDKNTKEGDGRG
jgi:hypothetical protein